MKFPTTSSQIFQSGLEMKNLKKKFSSVFSVSLIYVKLASLIKEHSINFFKQKLVSCVN